MTKGRRLVSRRWWIVLLALVGLGAWRLWPASPKQGGAADVFGGSIMGTTYNVKLGPIHACPLPGARAKRLVHTALTAVDELMSTYKTESEVSRFNRYEKTGPFTVSRQTVEVVETALVVHRQSGGAFDVTVGPVVRAWGFGAGAERQAPPDPLLQARLAESTGFEKLTVDPRAHSLTKSHPAVEMDLSGIAKGHAVDRAIAALAAEGCGSAMVEVGGEVRTLGRNRTDGPWRIGIERPAVGARALHRVIPLTDKALATSGDYRDFYEVDGRRVSHTIDPQERKPVGHSLASVTVVSDRCAVADAWATALNVLGPRDGPALAAKRGLAALFLVRQEDGSYREVVTPHMAPYLEGQPIEVTD